MRDRLTNFHMGERPNSKAMLRPSPVLKGTPRSFTLSQPAPRCWARISGLDSKLPQARITAREL